MSRIKDLTGLKTGKLTVLSFYGRVKGKSMWNTLCECGNKKVIYSYSLSSGGTKSCGCIQKEVFGNITRKHGNSYHPLFGTWRAMHSRCSSPKAQGYENYGGKGIYVCDRWSDFLLFVSDMGDKPTSKHSIDRIDNDKEYSPDNCRWATSFQQNANQGLQKNNTTGISGVTFSKGRFVCKVKRHGENVLYKTLKTLEEARELLANFKQMEKLNGVT